MINKIDPVSKILEVTKRTQNPINTAVKKYAQESERNFSLELASTIARIEGRNEKLKELNLILEEYDKLRKDTMDLRKQMSELKRGNLQDKTFLDAHEIYPEYMGQKVNIII